MAVRTLRRTHPPLPQAHRRQAVQMSDLRAGVLSFRSPLAAHETPLATSGECWQHTQDIHRFVHNLPELLWVSYYHVRFHIYLSQSQFREQNVPQEIKLVRLVAIVAQSNNKSMGIERKNVS